MLPPDLSPKASLPGGDSTRNPPEHADKAGKTVRDRPYQTKTTGGTTIFTGEAVS